MADCRDGNFTSNNAAIQEAAFYNNNMAALLAEYHHRLTVVEKTLERHITESAPRSELVRDFADFLTALAINEKINAYRLYRHIFQVPLKDAKVFVDRIIERVAENNRA